EENRPLYHAALALGANHLVTLVAQSLELLRAAGVGAPDRMLGPLLGAALDNALRSGDAALTGPVARGDAGTVATHIAELRRHAPATVAGYVAMARATADRALAGGLLKPELAEDLLGVLADGTSAADGGPGPARPDPSGPEGGTRCPRPARSPPSARQRRQRRRQRRGRQRRRSRGPPRPPAPAVPPPSPAVPLTSPAVPLTSPAVPLTSPPARPPPGR